jgi:6-pyruvoyltetrahydropterin/6-carboxytetrahydropterin synthase
MIVITKIVTFCAAHRYWQPAWDEAKNRAVFGACANPHGHGHNYRLEVSIAGEPDPETGMLIDLKDVKAVLDRTVLDHLDHRFLNHDIPHFRTVVPTTENLVLYIRDILRPAIPGVRIHRIRLWESDDLCAEWTEEAACSA